MANVGGDVNLRIAIGLFIILLSRWREFVGLVECAVLVSW